MTTSCVLMCDALAADADAVAGGRLAGDGDEGMVDVQGGLQRDQARDAEDDDPRPLRLDGRAEAARPAVVQVGDDQDLAAAPAASDRPRPSAPGNAGMPASAGESARAGPQAANKTMPRNAEIYLYINIFS